MIGSIFTSKLAVIWALWGLSNALGGWRRFQQDTCSVFNGLNDGESITRSDLCNDVPENGRYEG